MPLTAVQAHARIRQVIKLSTSAPVYAEPNAPDRSPGSCISLPRNKAFDFGSCLRRA